MNSKNRMKKIACRPERRNVKVLFMMRKKIVLIGDDGLMALGELLVVCDGFVGCVWFGIWS